ncbi:MAG: SufD family Fe-S cluster assembly protein [Candidatus Altiarchaeota archaeon]|nr:SufD family Fe-S cluster assembly protein [Candidatus Altiarchaeota archaeon]
MIINYGVDHESFHIKPKVLKGNLPVPNGFEKFTSAMSEFPKNFLNVQALITSDFSKSLKLDLKDSVVGMKLQASGKLHTELVGVNYLQRVIMTKPNEHLKISYRSKDSISYVKDLIYLSEGSSFSYDGRFKSKSGEFVNFVHVVHKKPNATSKVTVKGLVFNQATVLTTGELLLGSKGSDTSVNSFAVVFGDGKINAVPELLISDPNTTSFHSFKKIYLTPEQTFFLESRGIKQNNIEKFYERFILGD